MPKIVDAKKTILERVTSRHRQAVAESRRGEQSEAWRLAGEILETSGQIIYICTFKVLLSTLRATHAGITTFIKQMGGGL